MTIYQILSLAGVGTLCSLIVTFVFNSIVNNTKAKKKRQEEIIKSFEVVVNKIDQKVDILREDTQSAIADLKKDIMQDIDIIKKSNQALLRNDLYNLNENAMKKGFATIEEKNNFENLYKWYHLLGQNGVMDAIRDKYLELPEKKPVAKKKKTLHS